MPITFIGGTNTLELRAGSVINGNVNAFSSADTLALGGSTNSSFNVSQIGAATLYQGFGNFAKNGSSTWTLTGTNTSATPWTINSGALAISQDASLGAVSGGLTLDGGDLRFLSSLTSSRNFTVGTSDGGFDTGTSGTNVTLSGNINGPGSLFVEGAGILTLTGTGSHIGGDLDIGGCGCSVTTVKLVGGSLAVDGISTGLTIEGGRLEVTNGGTLQVGIAPTPAGSLLVAGEMRIHGPGSTVTVAGLTGVGIFGLGSLTISNGGVLNSQIGAEIDAFLPPLFGMSTVTVTGPGSTWNVGGAFVSVSLSGRARRAGQVP